jgi:hypothetical protein
LQRAGEGLPERLDTRRIAIDQVSKYNTQAVYQEDGTWQAHAQKALQRCKQPMGTGGHCCHAAALPTKVRLFMVQTFIYGHVWRGSDDEGGQRQDVSGRKEKLRSILAPASRDCLLF